jgi:digeranylgeranylglycerophospholipid reductase
VEKHDRVGSLVHCGEAVTRLSADDALEIRPEWIRTQPRVGRVCAPNGCVFTMRHKNGGYVLDRARMQSDLAADCMEAGGTLKAGWQALGLEKNGDRFDYLHCLDEEGNTERVRARVFIAADGVEGTVSRTAGLDNRLNVAFVESLIQYRLTGIVVDPNIIDIYTGSKVAPRSYAWVFPVSDTAANVGLGVPGHFGPDRTAQSYLDRFLAQHFPSAEIEDRTGGASLRYQGRQILARSNLLVVGDAARLLDSLTGGGIVLALRSGRLAGEAAAAHCREKSSSYDRLHELYPGSFLALAGDELDSTLRLKKFYNKLSDDELNDVVEALAVYFGNRPVESVDMLELLAGIVKIKPRLLMLARHVFT